MLELFKTFPDEHKRITDKYISDDYEDEYNESIQEYLSEFASKIFYNIYPYNKLMNGPFLLEIIEFIESHLPTTYLICDKKNNI